MKCPFCHFGAVVCQPVVGATVLLVESAYSTSVSDMPTPMRRNLIILVIIGISYLTD